TKKYSGEPKIELFRSYRLDVLANRYHSDQKQSNGIREEIVPLSTIYKHNVHDGRFLVFTDRYRWIRPPAGVVNLLSGIVELTTATVRYPWTGDSDRIQVGAESILSSIPELFFFNIRKGTFESGGDDFLELPVAVPVSGIVLD